VHTNIGAHGNTPTRLLWENNDELEDIDVLQNYIDSGESFDDKIANVDMCIGIGIAP
jgi:hypothetical protein